MKDLLFVLPGFPRHSSLTLESISYSPDFKEYLKNCCLTSNINLIEFVFCLRCFGFSPITPPVSVYFFSEEFRSKMLNMMTMNEILRESKNPY